jgi:hypothetical protein
MEFSKTNIKQLASALDIRSYQRARQRKYPQTEYVTVVDKFFSHKPVTLTEMNEICATEGSRWAYVESLLRIFPTHAAFALDGAWNGETIANGMVLAHAVTKATIFLPVDDFVFVFAKLMRHADEGGISFAEVAQSQDKAKVLDDHCYDIFIDWVAEVINSRELTLDLAMHTAGERFFLIGSLLCEDGDTTSVAKADRARIDIVKELLLGDREIPVIRARKRNTTGTVINA